MVKAIVGANWGDEGKGKITDMLAKDADIIIRFQGGANAGHTIVNNYGKFALHTLPSGVFYSHTTSIIGNGVALNIPLLVKEIASIVERGVPKPKILVSDRAQIVMPYHILFDQLEEERLAGKSFGSTKSGIAPFYSDKFAKKTVLAGELLYPDALEEHLKALMQWKNLTLTGVYGAEAYTMETIMEWKDRCCERLKPFLCDTDILLSDAQAAGKSIMFEAQLGALRDLDLGIYPYTTSSNTLAAYAPIGSGCPAARIDDVVGVVKAYSTCVGEGPFVSEMFGEAADKLRAAGAEYGAKTGRPRRVGAFDTVATRYGVQMQQATEIALTKLDVLSYLDKIPVCTGYSVEGRETHRFPFPAALDSAKPVTEYLPGWQCDISGARKWEDLPKAAQDYVSFIENAIGCPIKYISVGAERDSIIFR